MGAPGADAIAQGRKHELDAAIIPAGMSHYCAEDGGQGRPASDDAGSRGIAPLRQARDLRSGLGGTSRPHDLTLGQPGTGPRCVAERFLKFIGLNWDRTLSSIHGLRGNHEVARAMPDAIFSLSPLPSPFGEVGPAVRLSTAGTADGRGPLAAVRPVSKTS